MTKLLTDPIGDYELRCRRLIIAAREVEWAPSRQAILNAFQARPEASWPAHRIGLIATALEQMDFNPTTFQQELTKLVRQRFLRSRIKNGERWYELNMPVDAAQPGHEAGR
jgi:hypothetical protein